MECRVKHTKFKKWNRCKGKVREYITTGKFKVHVAYCDYHVKRYSQLGYGTLKLISRNVKPKSLRLKCDICGVRIKTNKDIGIVFRKEGVRITECRRCHHREYKNSVAYKRKYRRLDWI